MKFTEINFRKIEIAILLLGFLAGAAGIYAKLEVIAERLNNFVVINNERFTEINVKIEKLSERGACQNHLTNTFPWLNLNANAESVAQQA